MKSFLILLKYGIAGAGIYLGVAALGGLPSLVYQLAVELGYY